MTMPETTLGTHRLAGRGTDECEPDPNLSNLQPLDLRFFFAALVAQFLPSPVAGPPFLFIRG
jgi:hypothetical protein